MITEMLKIRTAKIEMIHKSHNLCLQILEGTGLFSLHLCSKACIGAVFTTSLCFKIALKKRSFARLIIF
jgi:hypothetical protein